MVTAGLAGARRTIRRALPAVVVGCLLVAPAPASSETIVFVKDKNVWAAAPDGSGLRQITTDGGQGGEYKYVTQADAGTVVAIRRTLSDCQLGQTPGSTSFYCAQDDSMRTFDRAGRPLAAGFNPTCAGGGSPTSTSLRMRASWHMPSSRCATAAAARWA